MTNKEKDKLIKVHGHAQLWYSREEDKPLLKKLFLKELRGYLKKHGYRVEKDSIDLRINDVSQHKAIAKVTLEGKTLRYSLEDALSTVGGTLSAWNRNDKTLFDSLKGNKGAYFTRLYNGDEGHVTNISFKEVLKDIKEVLEEREFNSTSDEFWKYEDEPPELCL